jgi:hypothetical protein
MYSPTLNTSKEGREIGSIRRGFLVCMEKRKGPGNTSCPHTFWIINRLFARPLVSLSDVDLLFSSFFRSFDFSHIVIIPWGALFWVPPHMTQPRPHLYLFFFFFLLFTSPSNFFFGVSKKLEHIRFGNSFENDSNQPAPILLVDGTIKD